MPTALARSGPTRRLCPTTSRAAPTWPSSAVRGTTGLLSADAPRPAAPSSSSRQPATRRPMRTRAWGTCSTRWATSSNSATTTRLPGFIAAFTHSYRWRLKQISQPAESLQIYANTTSTPWVQSLTQTGAPLHGAGGKYRRAGRPAERAADDTGAALAPAFSYDSRDTTNRLTLHQLPPRVRLALVAMDATTATRLAAQDGSTHRRWSPPRFSSRLRNSMPTSPRSTPRSPHKISTTAFFSAKFP